MPTRWAVKWDHEVAVQRHFRRITSRNQVINRWLLVTLVVVTSPFARGDEPPAMRVLQTDNGTRFGVFGERMKRPAPTFFVFATSVDDMARLGVYSQTGRELARHGWVYVTLEPPCHGRDAKKGEPAALSGWAHRVKNGEDLVGPFTKRCRDVLDWLIARKYTDPDRIAAGGTSRGGFCALHFAAAEPRVKAIACISPVTNPLALREFAGLKKEQTARSDAGSLADKLAGRPIWMSIGNHDQRVGTNDCIATSRKLAAASRKNNPDAVSPVELIVAPSKGHSAIDHAYTRAARFIADAFSNDRLSLSFSIVESGQMTMGENNQGGFDEKPAHPVRISRSFAITSRVITNSEYERFDPSHRKWRGVTRISKDDGDPAVYVSWHDAVGFCRWLGHKEGVPYRLPTEAEWEFARRSQPKLFEHDGAVVENWCLDGYGPYAAGSVTDPTGFPASPIRVTRGGPWKSTDNLPHVTNRLGNVPGDRNRVVGIRVVLGHLPRSSKSAALPTRRWQRDVVQKRHAWKAPVPAKQPWFAEPIPFAKIPPKLDGGPLFTKHNHCPGIAWCPNGDLLAVWYTTIEEWGREHAIAASRLRQGRDAWDEADLFWDVPDRNDHTPTIWSDHKGTLFHFNGMAVEGGWHDLAMLFRKSDDNGATWTKPRIIAPKHGFGNMPISSTFRRADGTICVPCDAVPGANGGSILHISKDNGKNWLLPSRGKPAPRFSMGKSGARMAGIHAAVDQWTDGSIVAVGRGDAINGRMPLSISRDGGLSWTYSASPFPPIAGGQRAALRRLRENVLMLVSFTKGSTFTSDTGTKFDGQGMFAALSEDGGKTWPIRKLLTDGKRRALDGHAWTDRFIMDATHAEPKGYLAATQTPDGIIHLISSGIHYRFNLAWLRLANRAP